MEPHSSYLFFCKMKSKTSSSGYFKSSRTVLYGRVWVPVAPFCFSPYTTDVLFKELATSGLTRRPTPHTFLKLNKRLFMLPHVTQSLSGPCRRKMLRDPQARYPTPLQVATYFDTIVFNARNLLMSSVERCVGSLHCLQGP